MLLVLGGNLLAENLCALRPRAGEAAAASEALAVSVRSREAVKEADAELDSLIGYRPRVRPALAAGPCNAMWECAAWSAPRKAGPGQVADLKAVPLPDVDVPNSPRVMATSPTRRTCVPHRRTAEASLLGARAHGRRAVRTTVRTIPTRTRLYGSTSSALTLTATPPATTQFPGPRSFWRNGPTRVEPSR